MVGVTVPNVAYRDGRFAIGVLEGHGHIHGYWRPFGHAHHLSRHHIAFSIRHALGIYQACHRLHFLVVTREIHLPAIWGLHAPQMAATFAQINLPFWGP